VVLSSAGYPNAPRSGDAITIDATKIPANGTILHAGTRNVDGQLVTAGGRVLNAVGYGVDAASALRTAYATADAVQFAGMHYRLDIGQTVVVKNGTVLAVEAVEGTNEAIRRGGKLGKGAATLVKVSKPNQDMRFDVPVVGTKTLEVAAEAGIRIIGVEAVATIVAGACGGVIQTTPYIGHPAYKAMGGRAAYTLATAVFIGAAGLTGTFAYLYQALPGPAILPILVFIGLEITAQSFHATPQRHYPAVAIACVPALAALVTIQSDKLLAAGAAPAAQLARELFSIRLLSSGFIVTSLLWAGMVAALIDRRLLEAAGWTLAAAAFTLFGIIHSPFPDGRLFLPWNFGTLPAEAAGRGPLELAAAYALLAGLFAAWHAWLRSRAP
jgi:hypothetical protein